MTAPRQPAADPQDEAGAIRDLPLPADIQEQVAGGGLKLEGIQGESQVDRKKVEINISSF